MRAACALGFVAAWLSIAVFAGGCGGPSQPAPAAPAPVETAEPEPEPAPVEPAEPADGEPAPSPTQPLTEAQCVQMVDHMIDVQLSAMAESGDKPVPTPEQVDNIRTEIKADFVPQCREQFTRAMFDCWLAASSEAEFEACAGGRAEDASDGGA